MLKHLELADDGQGVVIEEAPRGVQEILPRHKLGGSQTLGVSTRVAEHLLLGDINHEGLLHGGVQEGELKGGSHRLDLFVPSEILRRFGN